MTVEWMNMEIVVWQLFVVIGIALCVLEIFAPSFILLPIGLAVLMAAPASIYLSSWFHLCLILSAYLLLLFIAFSYVTKQLKSKGGIATNVAGLMGEQCEVSKPIKQGKKGEVKIYGEKWTAVSDDDREYVVGERVVIVDIKGNTLIINQ